MDKHIPKISLVYDGVHTSSRRMLTAFGVIVSRNDNSVYRVAVGVVKEVIVVVVTLWCISTCHIGSVIVFFSEVLGLRRKKGKTRIPTDGATDRTWIRRLNRWSAAHRGRW
ncbi:hypothetical protein QL285_022277 [Trifolium repens]|nr:hypothetical protein QL285_022277 [Trifolium repens]